MPGLNAAATAALKGEPIYLSEEQAQALLTQFHETTNYRRWELCGAAIMRNHAHVVVGVAGDPDPEKIIGDLKSYGSRALNRRWGKPTSETWWTGGGGSRRKLPDQRAILAALDYVRRQECPLVVWIADEYSRLLEYWTSGEPGA